MDVSPDVRNRLFPVFLKLETLHTLVVGGGHVALEKLTAIFANCPDAPVTLVAKRVNDEIRNIEKQYPSFTVRERKFLARDLAGKDLVLLATDDYSLHQRICALAKKRNLLVNVADTPELCDLYLGSIVSRGHLKIGISTNGMSPTMAKRIRQFFEHVLPDSMDELFERLHHIRDTLKGDFREKVRTLNEITASWVEKHTPRKG